MECTTCGPSKDHDILFSCTVCKTSQCNDHINNHEHLKPQQSFAFQTPRSGYAPPQQFSIDLSQLGSYRPPGMKREPTQEEYEWFLRSNPKVLTSGRESIDLIIGMALIAFVFGFRPILDGTQSWQFVLVLTLIVAPAFILHELAHKFAAIKFGKYARFALVRQMAYLTLLFGFIGFGLAGPGATMILGRSDKRETGIFAAAGPATNMVIGSFFIGLLFIIPDTNIASIGETLHWVFYLAIFVNGFLALFNLLPVSLLDGRKIKDWSWGIWVLLVLPNLLLVFFALPNM